MKIWFYLYLIFLGYSCANSGQEIEDSAPTNMKQVKHIAYNALSKYPHDTTLFTEGYFIHDGKHYESTGSPEELPNLNSLFGIRDLKSGIILSPVYLDKKLYFGEGIAIIKNAIYQLTYRNQKGFIYDATTFAKLGTFKYTSREGWGLTTDSINLIMSDGTNKISYINPVTFKIEKEIYVTKNDSILGNLNELEFVEGFIFANVFTTDFIVKINPETGQVVGIIDISNLHKQATLKNPNSLEANGIAYNSLTKHFYVTGKLWPYVFEILLE